MSNCPCISHVGLSSITNGAECLSQLNISYGPTVSVTLVMLINFFFQDFLFFCNLEFFHVVYCFYL